MPRAGLVAKDANTNKTRRVNTSLPSTLNVVGRVMCTETIVLE